MGAEVLAVPADVSDEGQVRTLVARAIERFGKVDVLVNNAGTILVGPAETMTVDDFKQAMATNFWGELLPILAVLPQMKAQGGGGSPTWSRSAARSRSRTSFLIVRASSPSPA